MGEAGSRRDRARQASCRSPRRRRSPAPAGVAPARRAARASPPASVPRSGSAGARPGQLSGAQARHLRAHPGPVGGVEEQQRVAAVVAAARPRTRRPAPPRDPRRRQLDQIHDQEGEVGADVDQAQRRVELDWIEDLDRSPRGARARPAGRRGSRARSRARRAPSSSACRPWRKATANRCAAASRAVADLLGEVSSVVKFSLTVAATCAGPKLSRGASGPRPGGPPRCDARAARTSRLADLAALEPLASVCASSKRRISTTCSSASGRSASARAKPSPSGTTARTPSRGRARTSPRRSSSSHMCRLRSGVP